MGKKRDENTSRCTLEVKKEVGGEAGPKALTSRQAQLTAGICAQLRAVRPVSQSLLRNVQRKPYAYYKDFRG